MIKRLTQAEKDLIDELYPIVIINFQYQSMDKKIGLRIIDNKTEQKILNRNALKTELIKDLLRLEFSYPIHELISKFELTEDEIMVILQYLYNKNLVTYYSPWNITFWSPKKY